MRYIAAIILVFTSAFAVSDEGMGHSKHGAAFDSGMRTKPWIIDGVGVAPFPITSKNPEVQKWFDQGNALLHSFWFEEAERSFRWCLKLDPDCAMAYWGLARCGFTWFSMETPNFEGKEFDRYRAFLKEAVRRKNTVSEKERLFIESWEVATAPETKERVNTLVGRLEQIVIKYPTDLEAKALLALFNIGKGSAFANQLIVDQVLTLNPLHPGAHHASIHNWDSVASEQALDSCRQYGKVAPGVGHALHMPGHIYSKVGMWHEAAIAMDSATRIELGYMNDRLALPFETWNYPHNRNYLCYIQEQLGMVETAIGGARDMLSAPRDPEFNSGNEGPISGQGTAALVRALIKFEKWEEIMTPGVVYWNSQDDYGKFGQAFAETLSLSGLNRLSEAKERLRDLQALKAKFTQGKPADKYESQYSSFYVNIAEGVVSLADGNLLEGQRALLNAAETDTKQRKNGYFANDPPDQPWPVMRLLGDDYRKRGENKLAVECYERALKQEPNDGFSLSGLALAHFANGNKERAMHYANRLEYVWSQANPNLKWLADVRKLGFPSQPIGETLAKERTYQPKTLDSMGPMNWRPFASPPLKVLNINGKQVQLSDYQDKNILLVFFLGEACVHCVDQLKAINGRMSDFEAQDTVVLGVCSASPTKLKESTTLDKVKIKFLSDTNHENARRFSSYDDFEEIELHSTIIIDKKRLIRWKRTGGAPFMNMDFLVNELKRINGLK